MKSPLLQGEGDTLNPKKPWENEKLINLLNYPWAAPLKAV